MTVFVSYARADHQTIQPVLSALREHGFELWIDEEGIEGASFWRKEIVAAIENSSVILFFATEASCISDAVFRELTLANEENKPILPVFLKTIKLPSDLRYQIAGIQNINLEHNLENGIRNIIVSLCRITATNSNKNIKVDSKALNVKKYVFQNKKFERIFFFFILVVSSVLGYLFIQNSEKPAVQNQISNQNHEEDCSKKNCFSLESGCIFHQNNGIGNGPRAANHGYCQWSDGNIADITLNLRVLYFYLT